MGKGYVHKRRHPFSWTAERIKAMKELRARGLSHVKISRKIGHGCTEGQVRHALKALAKTGTVTMGPREKLFSDDEDAFLKRTYCFEGWPTTEIAKAMRRGKSSVQNRIFYLRLRRQGDAHRHIAAKEPAGTPRNWISEVRALWTAKNDSARAELYAGQRYEDANVPARIPRCGRLG